MEAVIIRISALVLLLLAAVSPLAARAQTSANEKPIVAIVMTRHGVRSFTHTPAAYDWPNWSPVAPGYLTAHGYRLMTYFGRYYRSYFDSHGLAMRCGSHGTYVYADLDQRTLETARALIQGACGSPDALPLYHDARTGPGVNDTLFDGADWLVAAGKVDAAASRAAVMATLPTPPSAIVTQHGADFAALQRLLDARCSGTCPPVTGGASIVTAKGAGLAELRGPVDTGSSYAESLFLEESQCGPALDPGKLAAAMRLHVLEYDVNARNAYASRVRGGNIFAHIVGLLEEKAGLAHPAVGVPDISADSVVMISGHDTQLGALGGILDAHWALRGGLVADDMPPGGALIFELYRTAANDYRVRLRFAYETLAQYRSSAALPNGIATVAVRFAGCSGDDCSAPLAYFATLANTLARQGFVQHDWTPQSDAPIELAPLADPGWTRCTPFAEARG